MKNKIREFLISTDLVPENMVEKLDDNTNLLEEGIIESFNVISLVVYLETTFGITLNSGDLAGANFRTINSIEEFVIRKIKEKEARDG